MARLVMILNSLQDTREQENAETIHIGQDSVQNFCDEIEKKSICKYIPTSLRYLILGTYPKKERKNS